MGQLQLVFGFGKFQETVKIHIKYCLEAYMNL